MNLKRSRISILQRFLGDERGQTAAVIAVTVASIVTVAGASVEAGHVYYAYRQLVASTNAATLAGAQVMPDTTTASAYIKAYSSMSGQKNATWLLQSANATPTYQCLTTVSNAPINVACSTPTGGVGGYNAVKVVQTAQVPLWFGGLIGIPKFNLSATATASMRGGGNTPWNIAIILDTTGSMGSTDKTGQCTGQQIQCATAGVQQLLQKLTPCASGISCTSTNKYIDDVALYVFPPVLAVTAPFDYCLGGSVPTHEYYQAPNLNPLTFLWTYQIINFSDDYKTSNATGINLNPSSNIVKAVGYSTGGCSGIKAPGGAGTFYAQVIYTAQSDLIVQQTKNPGSQNAMIILSDGDATACGPSNSNTSDGACVSSPADLFASSGTMNGTGTKTTNPSGYRSYAYPSVLGECGQAVVAAQAASAAGTTVYTIGYNSQTSGGCASDAKYSATVNSGGGAWAPGSQPCDALAAMASTAADFYSTDDKGCSSSGEPDFTSLAAIFNKITSDFTAARLIPNGTT